MTSPRPAVYCKDCNFFSRHSNADLSMGGMCMEPLPSKKSVITGKLEHFYTTKDCKEKNKDFRCKDFRPKDSNRRSLLQRLFGSRKLLK